VTDKPYVTPETINKGPWKAAPKGVTVEQLEADWWTLQPLAPPGTWSYAHEFVIARVKESGRCYPDVLYSWVLQFFAETGEEFTEDKDVAEIRDRYNARTLLI